MYVAIDQGTTSTRAILFDDNFHIVKIARRRFKQIYPKEGWVEHDPEEIWHTVEDVMNEIIREFGYKNIKAVGITNQRETVVAWDAVTGKPLYNAIVWQCRRTAKRTEELKKQHSEMIHKKTGLIVDPYFSATKMEWMIKNLESVKKAHESDRLLFGTIDSYLAYKMTGKHVTDHSNASRTMLYNLSTKDWDEELLELFGIKRNSLPEIIDSAGFVGDTPWGIPLTGMIGDQQGALFGQIALSPGDIKLTMGTGSFILINTGNRMIFSNNGLLTTVAWKIKDEITYALEGSIFITGALIDWLISLGLFNTPQELSELAGNSDNGGVYISGAFTGLGAPHWDPTARGLIIGLTRAINKNHIARAAFEYIAFSIKELIDIMEEEFGEKVRSIKVDGGVAKSDVLLKIISKATGIKVERPKVTETTARGAAILSAVGGGWIGMDELGKFKETEKYFEEPKGLQGEYKEWKRAVERSKNWIT